MATSEPIITVKQQVGFVVRDGSTSFTRSDTALSNRISFKSDDSNYGSGLNATALGRLSSARTVTPPPQPSVSSPTTDYGVSPGLPRAGDVRPAEFTHLTPGVKKLMRSVMRGLKAHQDPEATTEGLGGTYFFRNESGIKIAIMKPCDEEPMAPNNPKGFVGRHLGEPGLKPTVRVGEAASREVAAYLLDHDHFARVPHTVMVQMSHPVFHIANDQQRNIARNTLNAADRTESSDLLDCDTSASDDLPLKLGSLQEFVPHECDTSEMGASRFNVRDVQRIGILDIRLFNTDRHAGNILVRRVRSHASNSMARMDCATSLADLHLKEPYELIPIDHGFALPEALEPPYFEWQHWPQALMPFGSEELEYITRLDARADTDMLRRELPNLREESLRLLEISTTLLKRCAAAGMSLSEIAGVVTRPLIGLDDEPSQLELLCAEVREEIEARALDISNEEEELGRSCGCEEDKDAVLTPLAEEEEVDDDDDDDDEYIIVEQHGDTSSPGAESASTHFQFDKEESLPMSTLADKMGSNASRQTATMDDALFSMDEDGNGARSPYLGASPDAASNAMERRLRAPSLLVERSGELSAKHGGTMGMSFGSALASSNSLPTSYDSDSPSEPQHLVESLDSNGGVNFPMAQSLTTGGHFRTVVSKQSHAARVGNPSSSKVRRHRGGSRRKCDGRAAAYPPLVAQRTCNGAPANGVFSCLTAAEWDEFLRIFEIKVDQALCKGTWMQNTMGCLNGPAPLLSCPKF